MRRLPIVVVITLVIVTILGTSAALAAKPQEVIEFSNGYPSGAHYNLNIHGKKDGFTGDATSGGNSVFIAEYGESTIQIVSNKKASLTELSVLDPLAECFDGDPAKVQLPSKELGYYVFARIHGKPNNGSKDGDPSSIILYPNPVLQVCNDTDPENPEFPGYTEPPYDSLLALGLVTTRGVYELTEQGLERFDDSSAEKGKGKSKALDITGLFMWTGYVCDASLDTNGPEGIPDGVIDEYDVPIEYDLAVNGGNENGYIDQTELDNWLADQVLAGNATYYNNEWVFNIADLVVQDQTINNDGTKLLQIRFYPVATTEFVR
ncbi:hypothetical protein ACFLX5_04950 [Chloroflexota bacterium]